MPFPLSYYFTDMSKAINCLHNEEAQALLAILIDVLKTGKG